MQATVDGKKVSVGDWVGFKSDIEQSGRITAIKRSPWGNGYELTLRNDNGFDGGYIGGDTITTESADRCWVE